MNVLKEKYSEVKIIFSIVMGFIGITGIQMQYLNYAQNVPGGGILAIVFFVTSKLYYQISIKRGIRFYIQVALSAFYAVILNFGIQLDLLSTIQLNGITLLSLLFLMIEIFPFIVCMMEYFDKKKIVGKEDKKSLRNCLQCLLYCK